MIRYLLVLLFSLLSLNGFSQNHQPFTHYLQEPREGQGSVTIVQDEEISVLVNNMPLAQPVTKKQETAEAKPTTTPKESASQAKVRQADTTVTAPKQYTGVRARQKASGFRIQVYSGAGNSSAKQAAKQMEAKVRKAFPELAVYCHFKSPRWVCRVGDFSTREEARRYLPKVRNLISAEASIVSDEVLLAK